MSDTVDKAARSRIMAQVRSKGNKSTELKVVRLLRQHRITGWRRHLPLAGRPDFAFPKAKIAVFIDGCFWHGCPRCYREPKSSVEYWQGKVARNKERDTKVSMELKGKGWRVLRVWECELKNPARMLRDLSWLINR